MRWVVVFVAAGSMMLGACGDSQRANSPSTSIGKLQDSTTTSAASSSSSNSSSTPSSATSSTTATVTTVQSGDPLALTATGIGAQRFGLAAEVVIDALTQELGAPSEDRVETAFSSSYGVCPGEQVRIVEWGGFVVLFTDGDTLFASGGTSLTFFDWRLRDLGAATPPLQTPEGIDLGDTTADVRSAYGSAVEVSDDDFMGPSFQVGVAPDQLRGSLTSVNDDGTVVGLAAGSSCGE